MNFAPSEAQRLLASVARDVFERSSPCERARRATESDDDFADLWNEIRALGWPSLVVPQAYGGQGGGLVDLAMLLEESGRALAGGPLLATSALGVLPILRSSLTEDRRGALLAGAAEGSRVFTSALFEAAGGWTLHDTRTLARQSGATVRIGGEKVFVPDAGLATTLLVLAREEAGTLAFFAVDRDAPGVTIERIPTLDGGSQWTVALADVEVSCESRIDGLDPEDVIDLGATAIAVETVGVAERAMELAVEWAKTREQFGRPIGSFQAVSHKCADMLVAVEAARSLAWYACLALDARQPDARAAASAAKAYVSDAAPRVAENGIQVHGGMGYTWEHDAHLYLRRARANEVRFGDAAFHRARVIDAVEWETQRSGGKER